ncbi:MAG: hypothetical protein PF486_10500 [Prolixibacteraceae bacterium]|nr:hypothetical protein [Prolixibacteraceae bacterium]
MNTLPKQILQSNISAGYELPEHEKTLIKTDNWKSGKLECWNDRAMGSWEDTKWYY